MNKYFGDASDAFGTSTDIFMVSSITYICMSLSGRLPPSGGGGLQPVANTFVVEISETTGADPASNRNQYDVPDSGPSR
ncbi:hypothetical protein [Luteibacter sp.]|uniref:hypothetical protein n=1 Tax=Luteibacter sp. TaxID=1886636 RepID=UPI003F7EFC3E